MKTVNPCIRFWGDGPQNTKCKTCIHLVVHKTGKTPYYKCDLRGITSGPGTDHRVNWQACARYASRYR